MRLIDADALKEAITQNREIDRNAVCDVLDLIDNAPTVSEITKEKLSIAYDQGYKDGRDNWLQEERPQGEWIDTGCKEEYWAEEYQCSICGVKDHWHNFCPNCGAQMRDEEDEEEEDES